MPQSTRLSRRRSSRQADVGGTSPTPGAGNARLRTSHFSCAGAGSRAARADERRAQNLAGCTRDTTPSAAARPARLAPSRSAGSASASAAAAQRSSRHEHRALAVGTWICAALLPRVAAACRRAAARCAPPAQRPRIPHPPRSASRLTAGAFTIASPLQGHATQRSSAATRRPARPGGRLRDSVRGEPSAAPAASAKRRQPRPQRRGAQPCPRCPPARATRSCRQRSPALKCQHAQPARSVRCAASPPQRGAQYGSGRREGEWHASLQPRGRRSAE